jgi:hypothetical protein
LKNSLKSKEENEEGDVLDKLFSKIKANLKKLKDAVLNCEDISAIVKEYED